MKDTKIEIKPAALEKDYRELNNNNNNKKVLVDTDLSVSSTSSLESIDATPKRSSCTSPDSDWVSTGTWRRRRITKDKTVSLKADFEQLGLEHVVPRHKSPKALSEMGKFYSPPV